MKTFIIGISGKKQSGKNTLCDSLCEWLRGRYGEKSCKIYSFADALKEKVCMDALGLSYKQCYGTDEEKNSLTIYKWENIPHRIRYDNKLGCEYAPNGEVCKHILPEGQMTAREVMQIAGTDIFRKYFDDSIWVNATFRAIEKENFDFALISDVRFPSEVEGVAKKNGIIFRLLRDVCESDIHESEIALDNYDWKSLGGKVRLIDNRNMSINEQNEEANKLMKDILKRR